MNFREPCGGSCVTPCRRDFGPTATALVSASKANGGAMKRTFSFVAILFVALTLPGQLTAQQHHHYKLIDMGTFGGPNSYFNTLLVTDGLYYGSVFYSNAQVRNPQGTFVGFADTATPDHFPAFCYVPECTVTHAFQWSNGVMSDLGALPGGGSSAAFWVNPSGLIVGGSQNGQLDPVIPGAPEVRAVIWTNGKIRDLGTLGGSSSFAQAANNQGQVTGTTLNKVPDQYSFYYLYLFCLPLQIC